MPHHPNVLALNNDALVQQLCPGPARDEVEKRLKEAEELIGETLGLLESVGDLHSALGPILIEQLRQFQEYRKSLP